MKQPRQRSRGPKPHSSRVTTRKQRQQPARYAVSSGPLRSVSDLSSIIMGRNCVREVLRLSPERIQEAWVSPHHECDAETGQHGLIDNLSARGVIIHRMARGELSALVGSESHQGVVARVLPRKHVELAHLLKRSADQERVILLALDGVLDPQNLGSILRAAECLGVHGVVWSRNRSAPLGPVVSKVSVGASEIVPLCPVSNLHRALGECKKNGFWVVGAGLGAGSVPLYTFSFPEKTVLVMGGEGDGLARLTEATLDFKVQIPMRGRIDSLNVSQATAVMLSAYDRQR